MVVLQCTTLWIPEEAQVLQHEGLAAWGYCRWFSQSVVASALLSSCSGAAVSEQVMPTSWWVRPALGLGWRGGRRSRSSWRTSHPAAPWSAAGFQPSDCTTSPVTPAQYTVVIFYFLFWGPFHVVKSHFDIFTKTFRVGESGDPLCTIQKYNIIV